MVNFPDYQGPSIYPNHPHLVPIFPVRRSCANGPRCKKKCFRFGLPLVVQKAKTVHSLQGATIGEGKTMRRIVANVGTCGTEDKWPNLAYTIFSRVKSVKDIAFAPDVSREFLDNVGKTKAAKAQRLQIVRLKELAKKTANRKHYKKIRTKTQYVQLLRWFITTCAQGLQQNNSTLLPAQLDAMKLKLEEIQVALNQAQP